MGFAEPLAYHQHEGPARARDEQYDSWLRQTSSIAASSVGARVGRADGAFLAAAGSYWAKYPGPDGRASA